MNRLRGKIIHDNETAIRRTQVSILPTFCEQLFHAEIPKVQKDNDDLTVFLRIWDIHV